MSLTSSNTLDIEITGVTETIFALSQVDPVLNHELHAKAPELGVILGGLVQDKTPVLTGSLRDDVTYEAAYSDSDPQLVLIYTSGVHQTETYKRAYVTYQEGPPLGEHTYTNPPRQMFLLTAEGDGRDAVEIWAQFVVQDAIAMTGLGAGAPMGGGAVGFA
jgi:hypothetical protein